MANMVRLFTTTTSKLPSRAESLFAIEARVPLFVYNSKLGWLCGVLLGLLRRKLVAYAVKWVINLK